MREKTIHLIISFVGFISNYIGEAPNETKWNELVLSKERLMQSL